MASLSKTPLSRLFLLVSIAWPFHTTLGQDLEPRRWTPLPLDTRVVGLGYAYTEGDIFFDPVLEVENAEIEMHTIVASHVRSFSMLDRLARLDIRIPIQDGTWSGTLEGAPASTSRDGLGDPVFRLSVNLSGAPPLAGQDFMKYYRSKEPKTVVGGAVSVTLPFGEYKEDKLLNLGQNRIILRPQLGVLHTRGPLSLEVTGSVFLFQDNDDFFGGQEREQDPLWAIQGHMIYSFRPGLWVSLSSAYGFGGKSRVNDIDMDDRIGNFLGSLAMGMPIGKQQSLKFSWISGQTQVDTGSDTDTLSMVWTRRL